MATEQILNTESVTPPVTPPATPAATATPATPPVVNGAVPPVVPPEVVKAVAPDAAAATKPPETPVAEVKYDLKLAEGSPLTQADVDEIVSFAKERGLSQEMAQEYLDREAGAVLKHNNEQSTKFEELRTTWYNEINNDKELGGTNLKATAEFAQRALDRFAPASLKTFLKESPYGNHPDLIRTFYKIGKAMSDDTLVSANAHSTKAKSYEDLLYDNTPKEN